MTILSGKQLEQRINTLFEQGRSLVSHEDDLVDRRLKWIITILAFVFAAYGATWIAFPSEIAFSDGTSTVRSDRQGEGVTFRAVVALGMVRIALVCLGIFVSILGAKSILAAHLAVSAVNRKYRDFIIVHEDEIREFGLQVWKLIGDSSGQMKGFYSSSMIPFVIAFVCAAIAWGEVIFLAYVLTYVLFATSEYLFYGVLFFGSLAGFKAIHLIWSGAKAHTDTIMKSADHSTEYDTVPETEPLGQVTRISIDSFKAKMKPFNDD